MFLRGSEHPAETRPTDRCPPVVHLAFRPELRVARGEEARRERGGNDEMERSACEEGVHERGEMWWELWQVERAGEGAGERRDRCIGVV